MYRWLDNMQARECGDSLAVFRMEIESKNYLIDLEESLKKTVEFKNGDRVYLIWKDDTTNGVKGNFIIGKRKPAPWKGYGEDFEETNEDF